jgi:hypothetical protein
MGTLANVKIGICDVTYKGVNLGHTKGSVKVSYKPEYEDVVVNQYGKSATDKVLTKEVLQVTVPIAESQLLNIQKMIPTSTGTTNIKFGSEAGARLSTFAGELLLHPTAVTGTSEDVSIYKAVVTGDVELEYAVDGQRVVEVTFDGLIDSTKANGNLFGHFGTLS